LERQDGGEEKKKGRNEGGKGENNNTKYLSRRKRWEVLRGGKPKNLLFFRSKFKI